MRKVVSLVFIAAFSRADICLYAANIERSKVAETQAAPSIRSSEPGMQNFNLISPEELRFESLNGVSMPAFESLSLESQAKIQMILARSAMLGLSSIQARTPVAQETPQPENHPVSSLAPMDLAGLNPHQREGVHHVIEGVLADFSLKELETMPDEGLRQVYQRLIPMGLSRSNFVSMKEGHGHDHFHGVLDFHHPEMIAASKKVLKISGTLMAVELTGGWITGSLALVADSAHMAIDSGMTAAPLISLWICRRFGGRGGNYSHRKTEGIIGLVGAGAITLTAADIAMRAYEHLSAPSVVPGLATILLAFAGLTSNAINSRILYHHKDRTLSSKASFLHFVTDAISSLGVMTAGLLMLAFGWSWPDPIAGFFIVVLILWANYGLMFGSWKMLFKSDS